MDPAHMHWASPLVSFLCMWVKMNISATFVVAYIQVPWSIFLHQNKPSLSNPHVQAMEIFPTCVRQSGIGFCSFISQMISIGGPYTIALGAHDLRFVVKYFYFKAF